MIAKLVDGMRIRCFQRLMRSLSRAGPSIVIVAWNDSISFRAINEYQSALPIIQLKNTFFDEFSFTYNNSQLSFEVPSYAFKYALILQNPFLPLPEKIILTVSNNNKNNDKDSQNDLKFTINIIDYYEINHEWEFFVSKNTAVLKAMVDMSNVSSTITCRCDIFDGIDKIFNKNNMIYLHIQNLRYKMKKYNDKKYQIMLTTEKLNYDNCLASILKFENSEKLIIDFDDELFDEHCSDDHEIKLSFSLFDFLIGIKIASIMSQRATISCSSPGYPIVIKASMPNAASFEMTIATCAEETEKTDEEAIEVEKTRKERSKNTPIVYAPTKSERQEYLLD